MTTTTTQKPNPDLDRLPLAPVVVQTEVGMLQNFCTLLGCPETRAAAIVDPAWEVDRLLREATAAGWRIEKMLITHGHHDHIEGIAEMARLTGASIVVNARELDRVTAALGANSGSMSGSMSGSVEILCVVDRQDVEIGRRGVRALETRGHTAGGTCYLGDGFVVTGDVLFVGGCGRTDFPGGDTAEMWRSLGRLGALPEEFRVFPGHNYGSTETSTIGRELLENPYLLCPDFESFRVLRERKRK
jgi:glyoxylase-like metal-dependent hydrolase (beta-lactamase superfamily II)